MGLGIGGMWRNVPSPRVTKFVVRKCSAPPHSKVSKRAPLFVLFTPLIQVCVIQVSDPFPSKLFIFFCVFLPALQVLPAPQTKAVSRFPVSPPAFLMDVAIVLFLKGMDIRHCGLHKGCGPLPPSLPPFDRPSAARLRG